MLDYEWEDGWSHPSWYFKEDGLHIATGLMGNDGKRTFQLTHHVLADGQPLRPDAGLEPQPKASEALKMRNPDVRPSVSPVGMILFGEDWFK